VIVICLNFVISVMGQPLRLLGTGLKKNNYAAGVEELKTCGQNAAFLLLNMLDLIELSAFPAISFPC
jgi:hypothetical protein